MTVKSSLTRLMRRSFSSKTSHTPLETDVCIVGSGPVGMVLSRMLTKFNVSNVVLEQSAALQNHPKAHYLSFRTCEILEDLLEDSFLSDQLQRYAEWNRFDYCNSVASKPFARVKHFDKEDFESWSKFSYSYPSHYSQNKLNKKLAVDCMFNQTYQGHTQD